MIFDDYFKIIEKGKYKGCRFYYEDKAGTYYSLPIELCFLFQNAIKNNYNTFYLTCEASHNINISKKDLNFLKKNVKISERPVYCFEYIKHLDNFKEYFFSKNTLKIKNWQYLDILKLYDLSIKTNKIGDFFIYPILDKNNKYCFNIFLISQIDFDINEILKINFDLIKIKSINTQNNFDFSIEFFRKLYDLNNLIFKDNIISNKDMYKINFYEEKTLPEKIAFNNFLVSDMSGELKNYFKDEIKNIKIFYKKNFLQKQVN